jgi:MTH538 TIR-like domain (DUF1863)/PDZ domain
LVSETNRYSAFLSYRHMSRDRRWAIRIMSELEAYRTPKALQREAFPDRIGRLFRDDDEIPASTDLSDQIKDALARSDFLIVVCSPDTPGSRWVRREIELFQEMGKSERIIPLLIAGEPDESFPPELRRRRIAVPRANGSTDFVWDEVEPVAADVRPRKDEGKSRTERRAILRLAAALLGCRFDDLARRDEERRKAKLRQQLAAAAALLSFALIGGLWWWDANMRVKTQYCASHGERWAAPFCVGELSAAQQKARTTSYRFHIQGGRVLDMARVNGADAPVDDEQTGKYEDEPWTAGVAEWRFAYRSDARFSHPLLASAALYDKTGKRLRQIGYDFSEDRRQAITRFDRNFGVAERQSSEGSALGLKAVERREISRHSSIGQHRLFFDAQGRLLRREFEPVGGGGSVADALGAHGRTYEYGATGLPQVIRNLDALGKPLIEKIGIVSIRRSYDAREDLTSVEWLDAKGLLRANEQWFAKVALVRDAKGNIEKYSYLSETGAPTIRRDYGVASLTRKYDELGNVVETAYFGVDGKPALDKNGVARWTARYDARGNEVERTFFDVDGKPTLSADGFAHVTGRFDERGNKAEVAFFDVEGKPAISKDGIAGTRWLFDERGNRVEEAYFAADGKSMLSRVLHVARATWRYDERGNQVEEAYFDVNGKPVLSKDGLARMTWRYDERGNQVEEAYFGANGEPTLSGLLVARTRWRYDEHGNQVEEAYFGVDGKPTLSKQGVVRWTTRYDERGNSVERAFFGVDGMPALNSEGNARVAYRYDERGNKIDTAFFGVDGKPTLNIEGCARFTRGYDERGNQVSVACFGSDDKPTLSVDGWARGTKRFDERGNVVENAFFDLDGNATLEKEYGEARATYRHDERGNRLEEAYFGVDDKPTLSTQGVARITWRFDERGKQVEQAYFGVDGKPTLATIGVARWTARYDERGNMVENAHFDAEGHAILVDGIGAKALYSYDDHDKRISVVYFDEHDKIVPVEVEVRGIAPGSTAARVGLKPGDRLLSYDGALLRSTDQLIAIVARANPGVKQLTYRRGETTVSVQIPPGPLGVTIANVRAAPP